MMSLLPFLQCGFDEMLQFQVLGEWVFSFRGMDFGFQFQGNGFSYGFHVGCWGRTRG